MNEFVAKNGLISNGNVVVKGSVLANSFTGSLFGTSSTAITSSWSSYAYSSSFCGYANQAGTAGTADLALNANHATTADSATNATDAANADHATTADYATSAGTAGNGTQWSDGDDHHSVYYTGINGAAIGPIQPESSNWFQVFNSNLTTPAVPTGLSATIIPSGAGNYQAYYHNHTYRVYAYNEDVNGNRVYSNGYAEISIADDGSYTYYYINLTWDAGGGVSGFRVVVADDINGYNFDAYTETGDGSAPGITDGIGSFDWQQPSPGVPIVSLPYSSSLFSVDKNGGVQVATSLNVSSKNFVVSTDGNVGIGADPTTYPLWVQKYASNNVAHFQNTNAAGNCIFELQNSTGTGYIGEINGTYAGVTGSALVLLNQGPILLASPTSKPKVVVHTNGIELRSKVINYNNIPTTGSGLVATCGTLDFITASFAVSSSLFTPTVAGMYRISTVLRTLQTAATSSVLGGVYFNYYTDTGFSSGPATFTASLFNQAGALTLSSSANQNTTTLAGSSVIYAIAGQPITVRIDYSSTPNSASANTGSNKQMVYNAHIRLEAI